MQHTIAAVFDKQSQAQQALDDLLASGFSRDDVHLSQSDDDTASQSAARSDLDDAQGSRDDESFGSGIRSFFSEIFGSGSHDHADLYSQAVLHGNYVLTVNVPDDSQVDRATDVLDRYDPVDIDEQSSKWKSGGWAAQSSMRQDSDASEFDDANTTGSTTSFLQEELNAGKRAFQRSGVRVFQRDEQSYATDESIGQEVRQRQQPLGDDLYGGSASEQLSGNAERSSQNSSSSGFNLASDDDDDSYFRNHWTSNFANTGENYEDYAPAYRYGSKLAGSGRYKGQQWDDVESDVRSDWESRNPGSTWEKMKDAVRHGWERMTS